MVTTCHVATLVALSHLCMFWHMPVYFCTLALSKLALQENILTLQLQAAHGSLGLTNCAPDSYILPAKWHGAPATVPLPPGVHRSLQWGQQSPGACMGLSQGSGGHLISQQSTSPFMHSQAWHWYDHRSPCIRITSGNSWRWDYLSLFSLLWKSLTSACIISSYY